MTHLKITVTTKLVLIASAILIASSGSAFADKPSWAGGGDKHEKHNEHEKKEKDEKWGNQGQDNRNDDWQDKDRRNDGQENNRGKDRRNDDERDNDRGKTHHDDAGKPAFSHNRYFTEQHRIVIREYYANEFRAGRCPPGLARKNNGCRPPGLAKKWVMGQPLPRNVIFYNLPPAIVINLGTPPANYRFVRVASDILMITTGLGRVVDVLDNLDGN
jgi:hypothetical protein